jgi:hypothetical protein
LRHHGEEIVEISLGPKGCPVLNLTADTALHLDTVRQLRMVQSAIEDLGPTREVEIEVNWMSKLLLIEVEERRHLEVRGHAIWRIGRGEWRSEPFWLTVIGEQ